MKILKRCRCNKQDCCAFDPTTCLNCGGRIIRALKQARDCDTMSLISIMERVSFLELLMDYYYQFITA